ncbi:MAG: hypothetical protein AB1530_05120 [Candidatus Omnitrophota bacterium]
MAVAWCSMLLCLRLPAAYGQEVTILFSGQTHAMLYPCNCPKQPDGGVARRATVVKEIRKSGQALLLVDAGRFFSGGLLDEFTQNTQLDMRRAEINLNAMESMKYDAVAVADEEFNFGQEFLANAIASAKVPFLSCNADLPGVRPYVIKDANGLKVGIIGITTLAAIKKASGAQFTEPKRALQQTLQALKKEKVDIVVLLSNLSEEESLRLIEDVGGIDVLVLAGGVRQEPFEQVGATWLLRSSWQGRELGKAVFTVKGRKIESARIESIRLSDEVADDKEIRAILPSCFSDANCKQKGMVGECKDGGSLQSQCQFSEAAKIPLTVISSKECATCRPERVVDSLKKVFTGLEVSYIYYPEAHAKELILTHQIKGLPAYLFGKGIEKDKAFDSFNKNLVAAGDFYIMKPEASGVSYFMERERLKGKFDLFVSLYGSEAPALLATVQEFNPQIHFLAVQQEQGFDALKGLAEVEDDLRAVCVQKYYPSQFWQYLECRAPKAASSWWDDCLKDCDVAQIKNCATTEEGRQLLRENISLNKELGIMFGPTYLIDNREVFSSAGVPTKEELRQLIKR